MSLLDKAIKIVRAKFNTSVHKDTFVIPQGPLTVQRPSLYAPDGIYFEDLEFFLGPGMSQDMGTLFTQKQLNESLDLKEAIGNGQVSYTTSGTSPIPDPVTGGSVSITSVKLEDSGGTVIDPATEETLQAVLAALGGTSTASAVNEYNSASVPAGGTPTVILTYTVPAGKSFSLSSFVAWGDIDAEYQLKVDSVQVGGGRSSIATPTLNVNYGAGVVKATTGQVVTIVALQYANTAYTLQANLAGSLI